MFRNILIFICLLITVLIIVFFLLPTYQEMKSFQLEIKQKESEVQYYQEKINHFNNLLEKLSQYQPELQKINSALPSQPSLPSLFYFLQKKAGENGLDLEEISAFSISPFKEKERIKQINFKFIVSGSYQGFKEFLSALEKNARIIEVEQLSFSLPIEEKTPISYQLTIKTYSY